MAVSFGTADLKIALGDKDIGKISLGDILIYTSGSVVTYHVDNDIVYAEEVESGESCLTPKGFVPEKDGWEFMGWTEDSAFGGSILTEKLMDDVPITLYAVFRHPITLTYYNDSTSASTLTKDAYYNNGNISHPHFEIEQAEKSGWISYGWTTDTAADSAISYASDASIQLDSDITLYGRYIQTVTVTYYNNSSTASSVKGTKHYNTSGNTLNPSFTLTQAAKSGWTARGWATGTTGDAIIVLKNGGTFERGSNYTLYGMYYVACNLYTVSNGVTKTNTGYRYYNSNGNVVNPAFTFAAPTRSGWTFKGWSKGASNTTVSYTAISGFTITASTYLYAVWNCANVAGSASLDYDQTRFFEGTETLANIISSVDTSKYSGVTFNFGVAETLNAKTDYRGTQIDVYISDGTNKTLIVYGYDDWNGNQVSNQGRVINPTLTFSSNSGNKPVYLTSTCHAYGQTTATGSTGYVSAHCTSYTLIGRTVVY